MKEATTVLCRDLAELHSNVVALGEQGYRIVAVIQTHGDELLTIVAQKDDMVDLGNVIANAVHDGMRAAE